MGKLTQKAIFALAITLLVTACKKDDPEPVTPTPPDFHKGSVAIEFHNKVGADDLVFEKDYVSPSGDTFRVSKFNYYISNIVLEKQGGGEYAQPESYFVVRHPSATKLTVNQVPPGTYTALRLMIGVDSTRNCSGAQTGGLDLATNGDMFWSWTTGYIFMKIEGSSPQSGAASKALTFHVGGFKGADKTQREIKISLGNTPLVINENAGSIRLVADVNSIFSGPHNVSFATLNHLMQPGPGAKTLADNYSDMLTLENVSN